MKNSLIAFCLAITCLAGEAQTAGDPVLVPKPPDVLLLKETKHDFSKIPQGRPAIYSFQIMNTGQEPLSLTNVQASCGCTTPEWSRSPIAPGATSWIKVGYNAYAEGPFTKTVTITYGNGMAKTLTISGEVYKTPPASAPDNASVQLLKQINQ
jgi:hypothetical protein